MSEQQKETPNISEYQGKPMLVLNPSSKFTFSFGLAKAKMIVDHIETIKKFVDSNGNSID